MQYAILFAAVLGLASAQTSTSAAAGASATGTSGCGSAIDNIVNTCLQGLTAQASLPNSSPPRPPLTSPQASSCGPIDWQCKCDAQKAVNTCYNNCPSDPRAFGSMQQQESWCNAAKAYPSSTTSASASQNTNDAKAAASSSTTDSGAIMPSSTSASASAASSHAAAVGIAVPASGVLAAVFGVAALL